MQPNFLKICEKGHKKKGVNMIPNTMQAKEFFSRYTSFSPYSPSMVALLAADSGALSQNGALWKSPELDINSSRQPFNCPEVLSK